MNISKALYELREIDEIAERNTLIHKINPVIKILVTFIYIIKVLLLKELSIYSLIGLILYPLLSILIGNIRLNIIFRKLIFILPVILGMGMINLMIDFSYNQIINIILLILKCILSATAGLILIMVTGIYNLGCGLRKLRVPKLFVMQILMVYRYITVMIEQLYRIKCAYELRTLSKRSMELKDYSIIIGQMLLRTVDQSEKIYAAMKLRGFKGEYITGIETRIRIVDWIYFFSWIIILYII